MSESTYTPPTPEPIVLPQPEVPVKPRRVTVKRIAAGVLILGALAGSFGIGRSTTPPRPECAQALELGERALVKSGEAISAISDTIGGGYYSLLSLPRKLEPLTADIKAIQQPYKDAKEACIK